MKLKTTYLLISLLFLNHMFGEIVNHVPQLVVNGHALLHKPADQVTFTLSIISQASTAEQCLRENNERINSIVLALNEIGLQKGEYHTGQFSIRPVYSLPPHHHPSDWKASILAYEVTNTLNIQTQKLELTPIIIDTVGKGRIDQISGVSFGIKNLRSYRKEVLSEATANAIQDATTLADAANLKLVRILDVRIDSPQSFPRPMPQMYYSKANGGEVAPFIEAPDVDLSANVSVVFEITSK